MSTILRRDRPGLRSVEANVQRFRMFDDSALWELAEGVNPASLDLVREARRELERRRMHRLKQIIAN